MSPRNHHYVHCCHWCGKPYQSSKCERDARFCSARCKQAHYRAYKKYVTLQTSSADIQPGASVTRKKQIICPSCNRPAIRVETKADHKTYIHKEAVRGMSPVSCSVSKPKKRKKRK